MKKYSLKTYLSLLLLLFNATLIRGSDLFSISSLTKEEKKIYLLGTDVTQKNNLASPVLSFYQNFLINLTTSPLRTLCILNGSKQDIYDLSIGEATIDKSSLNAVALQHAAKCNYQSGMLEYKSV